MREVERMREGGRIKKEEDEGRKKRKVKNLKGRRR